VLCDVELREHFDPRDHRERPLTRNALELAEHTVDAQADEEPVRLRQEVDVACSFFDRLGEERVDKFDERARSFVLRVLDFLLIGDALALVDGVTSRRLDLALEVAELELDVFSRRNAENDLAAGGDPELVDGLHVGRIGDRNQQAFAVEGIGNGARAHQRPCFDRIGRFAEDTDRAQVDEGQVEAFGDLTCDGDARGTAADSGRAHAPRMSWTRAASSCGLNGFAM
jgi:hypothetical protein